MKLKSFVGTFVIGVALSFAPAVANSKWEAKQAALAGKIMHEFAACVVESHPDLAREFVMMSPHQWVPQEKYEKLAGGKCLGFRGGKLQMQREYYRGALANRLITEDLNSEFKLEPSGIAALTWEAPNLPSKINTKTGKPLEQAQLAKLESSYNLALGIHYVAQLGECIVRAAPVGARNVVDASVDSPAEMEALKVMNATIAGCVVSGQTLKFNRTNLRNAIAISYYRLAKAQLGTGASF